MVSSLALSLPLAAVFNLNQPGSYLHWGLIQISLANFIVIVLMVAVIAAALLLRFPGHGGRP